MPHRQQDSLPCIYFHILILLLVYLGFLLIQKSEGNLHICIYNKTKLKIGVLLKCVYMLTLPKCSCLLI